MEIDYSHHGAPVRRSSKITWFLICLAIAGLAFGGGFFLGGRSSIASGENVFSGLVTGKLERNSSGKDIDFKLFWEVWDIVKKEYVDADALTEKKLFYGALQGLVQSTDDPYSVFLNPEEAKEFDQDLAGTFEGIGAEIGYRNEILTIMAPIEDMPAMKAGVRAGDQIYKINGETTTNFSLEEAIKKIRGPKGTTVTLTLLRAKESKPIDISIVRDTVIVKSIKTTWLEKEQIFVIKVYNFNDDTTNLFNQAVSEALRKKSKGLVLDLRNNPGGYLDTAVAMASAWIPEGSIVIEQFGDNRNIEHSATGNAPLVDMPTAVLVNQGSASASEIVAGALKDYGKAILIGEKTFGKGSVQVLRDLSDGSVIKVTTAKWLTPKGSYIHETGIEPEIIIERTSEDRAANKDPQLDRAIEELQK
ncbi:S41 family peptidase [Candidatus Falkowbacteria bacterium]|nr:MAG: S41 family peptidase [Candidatus Falkowbacteria bacterium]